MESKGRKTLSVDEMEQIRKTLPVDWQTDLSQNPRIRASQIAVRLQMFKDYQASRKNAPKQRLK